MRNVVVVSAEVTGGNGGGAVGGMVCCGEEDGGGGDVRGLSHDFEVTEMVASGWRWQQSGIMMKVAAGG
ncbi:hypothetical protein Tco_0948916 [Tanacetum coccineum]